MPEQDKLVPPGWAPLPWRVVTSGMVSAIEDARGRTVLPYWSDLVDDYAAFVFIVAAVNATQGKSK